MIIILLLIDSFRTHVTTTLYGNVMAACKPVDSRPIRVIRQRSCSFNEERVWIFFLRPVVDRITSRACLTTPCPQKTKQSCFCQNFVKCPPTLIIF